MPQNDIFSRPYCLLTQNFQLYLTPSYCIFVFYSMYRVFCKVCQKECRP